ncbi:CHAP domain-containing protein [Lentzea sp. HUAS12]|uniref:CHAP domain-containing protein n=1 Tax=Lentzea sp. HUAS12 TaxID=2951806 RepID=UPI0020A18270|nr:CHAP domain-containing protein [Lentzea sp. HUAS12]USX52789.1 CHAP domain-containing protein [Lentzea sp. HUAS12]
MAGLFALIAGLLWPTPAQALGNDYPWPNANMNQLSPLRFNYRNCTDYAAWTLNVQLGGSTSNIRFDWGSIQANNSGHARDWRQGALNRGKPVNDTPARGAVAWWGASQGGGFGHVAIVAEVLNGGGSVVVHEYNRANTGVFGTRTLSRSAGWPEAFLHIADIPEPQPQPSSRRSSTNVVFGPSGFLEVYGRSPANDLVHKWYVPGTGWQPSPYGDFEHLGTGLGGEPTAIRRPSGVLDVFARSTNGDLLHKWLAPGAGWGPSPYGDFERLGTGLGGDPIAIVRPNGLLDVFARGTNGDLLHKWLTPDTGWQPSPFGDFERLGTGLGGDPVAVVQANGQLDVFARGSNGDLLHKWATPTSGWQPSPFGDFERLGTGLASDVAAIPLANGQLHVFGRGPTGDLMHKWTSGTGWQPSPFGDFERLGGGLASEPVVLQQANGQLDVFGRGTTNELWHKWLSLSSGWQPSPFGEAERLGTGLAAEPSLIQQPNGQLDVFGQGTGGDLVHKWAPPGAGWQPSPFGDFEHLGAGF